MGATRRERLDELYRRLTEASLPSSADEAFDLICRTLEQVEDDLSGIPRADPPPTTDEDDGRMYRPLGDNVCRTTTGGIVAMSKGHRISIDDDGRITIRNRLTGDVEFQR